MIELAFLLWHIFKTRV